jgi:hypothetical protein
MSSEPIVTRLAPGWARPFSSGYACRTGLFFSCEVLLWTHVCMATQVSESLKFFILENSIWLCCLILLLGVAWSIPYLRSTFRAMEIVVDDGPSLITELIPHYLFTGVMAAVTIILAFADYEILEHQSFQTFSLAIFAVVGLFGLEFAINSKIDYPQRVLIASTLLSVAVACPTSFTESSLVYLVALSLVLSSLLDALLIKQNHEIAVPAEILTLRFRMIIKLSLALTSGIRKLSGLSIPLILACMSCDTILHIQERRWGTFTERIYRKYVPSNSYTEA